MEQWAETRGIDVKVLSRFCVVGEGEREGWLGIPYPNRTGTWGTNWRNPTDRGPKYIRDGGAAHLYNPLRLGPNTGEVWFVEGEIDTMIMVELGYPAIGVPGVGHAENLISRDWRYLFLHAMVYVMFDGDEPGRKAAAKLMGAFQPNSYMVDLPDGKDVNDLWVSDRQVLLTILENARDKR